MADPLNKMMQLLRAKDVAAVLNCSISRVYSLKESHQLPFCKIGGMVRFRVEDVDELVKATLVQHDQRRNQYKSSKPLPKLKHLRLPSQP